MKLREKTVSQVLVAKIEHIFINIINNQRNVLILTTDIDHKKDYDVDPEELMIYKLSSTTLSAPLFILFMKKSF